MAIRTNSHCRFVFKVNNQEKITDVTANEDGRWHHICVTWSSDEGQWQIYKDGELADEGDGLAVGTDIEGIVPGCMDNGSDGQHIPKSVVCVPACVGANVCLFVRATCFHDCCFMTINFR